MSQTILETHGTIPMYQLLYKKKNTKKTHMPNEIQLKWRK